MSYGYETRTITFGGQLEHYDRDFQMDTAFYNRTGFTAGWLFADYSFYPKSGTDFWLQRMHPFIFTKVGHDDIQDGKEAFLNTGLRFNLTRQGFVNISHQTRPRAVAGHRYDFGSDVNFFGAMQVLRWLNVFGGGGSGPAIFYDPVDHFQGRQPFATSGFDAPAEPEPDAELRVQLVTLRSRRHRRTRSTASTSSTPGRRTSSTSTSWCASSRSTTARQREC